MNVRELNRDQLDELKQQYVCEMVENPSWAELASATTDVSDETIFVHYDGIEFVNDDFFCNLED